MKRLLTVSAAVLVAAAGTGCQSHSIREGVWMLTFDAQDSRTQESIEPYLDANQARVHQVGLRVDWASDGGEVVEVNPRSSHSQTGKKITKRLSPFFGEIAPGGREIVLKGQDNSWVFQMIGRVDSDEEITGSKFLARMRLEDEAVEGRWSMHWVSD